MAFESRGFERSLEKFNRFYLRYHDAYDHQTWQGSNMQRGVPTVSIT